MLHGREVLYVVEQRARGRPPLVTDVGVRLPAQLTASGRAMLADLPLAHVRALFPDATAFVDRHGTGPRRLSDLRRLLLAVRRDRPRHRGRRGDARVRLDGGRRARPRGPAVAGVAVTFPTVELDDGAREELARRVTRAAAELTRRINGRPPTS